MPAAWVGAAVGAYNALSGPSGGSGGGGSPYVPPNLGGVADQARTGITGMQNLATGTGQVASPYFAQSLAEQNAINYSPYLTAANEAGGMYPALAALSAQQGAGYGQEAQLAQHQQQGLYGAGMNTYLTALDPRSALYDRTAQQLTDQINAGQALRGLGNSPVGAAEYNQAMGNFNIDWQNQQLQRQINALQAMGTASNAGGAQGQLYGADLTGQMGAYGAMPGYIQQGAQIPITAQQYVAGMPAQNASGYVQNMGNLLNLYGSGTTAAQNYLNTGSMASNTAAKFNANQNAANAQLLMQSIGSGTPSAGHPYGTGLVGQYNTPGSWLNRTFSPSTNPSYGDNLGATYTAADYGGGGG